MAKFSVEEKIKAVLRYLNGTESYGRIAKSIGIDRRGLRMWVALYHSHGEDGLKPGYTNYSPEFKMEVIKYMLENRTSLLETAVVFKISSDANIRKWKEIVKKHGYDGLFQMKKGRPKLKKTRINQTTRHPNEGSLEVLIAENERLRMENEYLKKLNALVQRERKLKTDKKH